MGSRQMRALRSVFRLGVAAALAFVVTEASAGDRAGYGWRHAGHGRGGFSYGAGYDGGAYRFAGPAISGDYVGAPFTRFPRTTEIVPPAWGYGTYGVPTVTGITQAPAAQPTIYALKGANTDLARRTGFRSRIMSRDAEGHWADDRGEPDTQAGGARIVSVTVSRR